MPELENLLWVFPGIVFLYIYNKKNPSQSTDLSGWSYVFLLVIIASFTWLPFEEIFDNNKFYIIASSGVCAFILSLFVTRIRYLSTYDEPKGLFWKFILNTLRLKNLLKPEIDIFLEKCNKWENDLVIVGLKNLKVYIGVLLKYTENTQLSIEKQTISISPVISGGRKDNNKEMEWTTVYQKERKDNLEILIPSSEIVTFGKFDEQTFKHFNPSESHK